MIKFNNFFKQHLVNLLAEEALRDPYCQSSFDAPKYSVCFLDLADYLHLKDDVLAKLEEKQKEDKDIVEEQPLVFSDRKEDDRKQKHPKSMPGSVNQS